MKINNSFIKSVTLSLTISIVVLACSNQDFEQSYPDPAKIKNTTVEKQYTGFLKSNVEYVVPNYWNYFVVLSPTANRYTQAVGWINATQQYVPGGGLINDRWGMYYAFLSQFRELENVFGKLSQDDQNLRRIYLITAAIYLYDETQKVIDLHGDIPFLEAGKIGTNGGDYLKSTTQFDKADVLYSKMLDDLKGFSAELNSISVPKGIQTGFAIQDYINKGDLTKWRTYCNSLRIRMLMRVSDAPSFQSRASAEIQTILGNPSSYPIVDNNTKNVQITVFDLNTEINAKGFRDGIGSGGWNYNLAGKAMIDQLGSTQDPRLRVMFEPGQNAKSLYGGLDQMANATDQTNVVNAGLVSIYNRSTYNQNQYFPGMLITAAEINLLLAEYYLKAGNDASAKTAYNLAIDQSINQHFAYRKVSNDNVSGAVAPLASSEIVAYQTHNLVSWDMATDNASKLKLIAIQKWLNYNIVQPLEGWAELRRLDLPAFSFWVDKTNAQKQPPYRWFYSGNEKIYNATNYSAVAPSDNLGTKLFWDVK
jgi:Starch-binding associating with outer membrane